MKRKFSFFFYWLSMYRNTPVGYKVLNLKSEEKALINPSICDLILFKKPLIGPMYMSYKLLKQ